MIAIICAEFYSFVTGVLVDGYEFSGKTSKPSVTYSYAGKVPDTKGMYIANNILADVL